jgi:hypothetical protein
VAAAEVAAEAAAEAAAATAAAVAAACCLLLFARCTATSVDNENGHVLCALNDGEQAEVR